MNEMVINVEGKSYVVNRQSLMSWLSQNGKVFTGQSNNINEINRVDDAGRTILNG
jgi:hypothetical protein